MKTSELLNKINPVYMPDSGDCFCAIMRVLFQYYGIKYFNRIYEKCNSVELNEPISISEDISLNQLIEWKYIDYGALYKLYYNIDFILFDRNVQIVRKYLSEEHPVLIGTKSNMCPWRKNDYTMNHSCLILDYEEQKGAVCIDPVFTDKLVLYPEKNLLNDVTVLSVLDVADIRYADPFPLSYSINEYLENSRHSLDVMKKIYLLMKSSIDENFVNTSNVEKYFFDSTNSFYINKRHLKIMNYFKYLKEVHNISQLDKSIDLYEANFTNTMNLHSMLTKYELSNNPKILHRYIEIIETCNKNEEISYQIIRNYQLFS